MEIILMLFAIPLLIYLYLIILGGKECYFCGKRLDEKERPIYSQGKRTCFDCTCGNDKGLK